MLRDTFPSLLGGQPAPAGERIWELSRFAVDTSGAGGVGKFGLSVVPILMMRDAVVHARSQGVEAFVTVTTVAIERLLRQIGLKPKRLGPVLDIGVERTVALAFDTDSNTESALRAAVEKTPIGGCRLRRRACSQGRRRGCPAAPELKRVERP